MPMPKAITAVAGDARMEAKRTADPGHGGANEYRPNVARHTGSYKPQPDMG